MGSMPPTTTIKAAKAAQSAIRATEAATIRGSNRRAYQTMGRVKPSPTVQPTMA